MDRCYHGGEKQQCSESFIVLGSPSLGSVYCNINVLGLSFYDCVSIKAQVTGCGDSGGPSTVRVILSSGLEAGLHFMK